MEAKREDAIAKRNLAQQAKQIGVNVNLDYLFEQVMETFEGMDKKKVFAPPALPQMGGMPQMP